MNKRLWIPVMALFLNSIVLSGARAQDHDLNDVEKSASHPNSSFPASASPDQPPNEPDHTFGKSSGTLKLPDHNLPDAATSDTSPSDTGAAPMKITLPDPDRSAPEGTNTTGGAAAR